MKSEMKQTQRNLTSGEKAAMREANEMICETIEKTNTYPRQKANAKLAAKKALEISPYCVDAYMLLAEMSPPASDERIAWIQKGMAAGEAAIGDDFDEYAGNFWGLIETRPYMRAREALAHCLWSRGERGAAISNLEAMLALNPTDNQGVRGVLAEWLFIENRHADLEKLFGSYPNDVFSTLAWTAPLSEFSLHGDTKEARQRAEAANKINPYVPDFLLGRKRTKNNQTGYMAIGGEDEAESYAIGFAPLWRNTYGSLAWLKKLFPKKMPMGPRAPRMIP